MTQARPGEITRRTFCKTSSSLAAAALASPLVIQAQESANDKVIVGVMGCGGRGTAIARQFAGKPNCEVAFVCDVDSRRLETAAKTVETTAQGKAPKTVTDLRRILDEKDIDVLAIAAPNHWHAPAAIMGCNAGKHVYCEKPCSHNPQEGEWLVQVARKHNRLVQHGTQRRSWPGIVEGIQKLHEGIIGKVLTARSWYYNERPTIGKGKPADIPEWLNYELWQGPAPEVPFRDNILHYNWHWFWHWGNAELGNNGVHMLDVCRWGMQVDYPTQVVCGGGHYRYDDDQETPDTCTAVFDFGDKSITWDGRSWGGQNPIDAGYDCAFFGEDGFMAIKGGQYKAYDKNKMEIASGTGRGGDEDHFDNFLASIRGEATLNAEIEEGHKSALMCHLGNIAYRTGHTLKCDPQNGHLLNAKAAQPLWRREYRPGWEPVV